MSPIIPAAAALVIHKGKILLVRSSTTQLKWAFPGGKQENNETPQSAASREIREELGIDIEIQRELGSYMYAKGNRSFIIKCFVAETAKSDLRIDPDEIIEARWCTLKEGLALDLTSSTRRAIGIFISESKNHK
jgi:8-oxo-dGTP diphosphatase